MKAVSMRGQSVDMGQLMTAHATKAALGNANMNARGDRIDAQGNVVETSAQVMSEYNASNPNAVKHVGLSDIRDEVIPSPSEALALARKQAVTAAETNVKQPSMKRKIADSDV